MSSKKKESRQEKTINLLAHYIKCYRSKHSKDPVIVKGELIFEESFILLSVGLNNVELEHFKKYIKDEK